MNRWNLRSTMRSTHAGSKMHNSISFFNVYLYDINNLTVSQITWILSVYADMMKTHYFSTQGRALCFFSPPDDDEDDEGFWALILCEEGPFKNACISPPITRTTEHTTGGQMISLQLTRPTEENKQNKNLLMVE